MSGGEIRTNSNGSHSILAGGGVLLFEGSPVFSMSGGKISGNSANSNNGGGGVQISNGEFTMSGGEISGNTANTNGGGVFVNSNVTFTMSGGAISGNNAGSSSGDYCGGGGVYVASGTFILSGGAISSNNANSGGGVYVKTGEFTMSGGTIGGHTTRNKAYLDGGGVYIYDASFNMTGGLISYNENDNYWGNGGGIYMTQTSVFTFSGGEISYNTCTGSAGGIMVEDHSALTMSGTATIKGNESSGEDTVGGGVRVSRTGSFTMSGGTISGNKAKCNGYGVYVADTGTFTMSGSAVVNQDNDVYLLAGRFITVGALTGSGPVAKITPETQSDGTVADGTVVLAGAGVTLTPGIIGRFTLSPQGYSIYLEDNKGKMAPSASSLNDLKAAVTAATGGTIDHPVTISLTGDVMMASAEDLITLTSGQHIKLVPDTGTRTIKRGASGLSSLFTVERGASLTLEGSGGNKLIMDGGNMDGGNDEGITAQAALVTVAGGILNMGEGAALQNNEIGYGDGGGVYVCDEGKFNMSGGAISNNTGGDGGGVYIREGQFTMTGGSIEYNTATSNGGGVNIGSNGSASCRFIFSGGVIQYNIATGSYGGGGISIVSGAAEMSGDAQIRKNIAYKGGGVFILAEQSLTKTGGWVYGSGDGADGDNANEATDANGGHALYNLGGGTVTIGGKLFTGTTKDDTF